MAVVRFVSGMPVERGFEGAIGALALGAVVAVPGTLAGGRSMWAPVLAMPVLLAVMTLAIYKPWGRTSYGRRRQPGKRPTIAFDPTTNLPGQGLPGSSRRPMAAPETVPGGALSPALKVLFAVIVIAAVAFIGMHLIGGNMGSSM